MICHGGVQYPPHNSARRFGPRCRQLASLGATASAQSWGVEPFEEQHRDTHTFTRRTGRLPEQKEGDELDFRSILHRDGSVLSAPTLSVHTSDFMWLSTDDRDWAPEGLFLQFA